MAVPTAAWALDPMVARMAEPTVARTAEPMAARTAEPTAEPMAEPTVARTAEPTAVRTAEPTAEPTVAQTAAPIRRFRGGGGRRSRRRCGQRRRPRIALRPAVDREHQQIQRSARRTDPGTPCFPGWLPSSRRSSPATTGAARPCSPRPTRLPSPYADLLDADAIDELVSERGLRTPFLRVAKGGSTLGDQAFTAPGGIGAGVADQVSDDKLVRLFADGSTLVLQGLHRVWPPIIAFCQQLAAELGHPVQANAYVTPPQNQGFSNHYDVHDVFVLQIAGEKRWQIHAPVLESPLRDQPWTDRRAAVERRAEEEPLIETVLRPGDCLYLPRGYPARGQGAGRRDQPPHARRAQLDAVRPRRAAARAGPARGRRRPWLVAARCRSASTWPSRPPTVPTWNKPGRPWSTRCSESTSTIWPVHCIARLATPSALRRSDRCGSSATPMP